MKKNYAFIMIIAIIMSMSGAAFAQDFEGVINYKIIYPEEMDAAIVALMPTMSTVTISGHVSKFEMDMGQMGGNIVSVINFETKTGLSWKEGSGEKIYSVMGEEDFDSQMDAYDKVSIDIKDETKEIAGYECKKAVVTVTEDSKEMSYTVYFTEEIVHSAMNTGFYMDIPGTMLEFELVGMGIFEAASIDKRSVPESEFEVPEGYTEKAP